jgi:hypothetical protein
MFTRGQRVQPTNDYRQGFPSRKVERGTVLRQHKHKSDLYVVKWDGRSGDECLHEKFLAPAEDLQNSEST